MRQLNYQNSQLRILNEKIAISNYYYFLATIILILFLIINIPYQTSYNYSLVKDDNYKIIVDDNYFPIKNNYLLYNHKKYFYSVVEISDAYILDNRKYYNVFVNIKNNDLKKDKNIYNITVVKKQSTLLNDFIKKLKKG